MTWINLEQLLQPSDSPRPVTLAPALDHAGLCQQALQLAAGLQHRGVQRVAVYLEDAGALGELVLVQLCGQAQ